MKKLKRSTNIELGTPNEQYHQYLTEVLELGYMKPPVRGQEFGTHTAFGLTSPMVFDLRKGIPVVSTKKLFLKGIIEEFKWFLSGSTNVKPLRDVGVHIWDDNAYAFYKKVFSAEENILSKEEFFKMVDKGVKIIKSDLPGFEYSFGDLGRMYGYQLRKKKIVNVSNGTVIYDQVEAAVKELIDNPYNRQVVIDCYDPYDKQSHISALPPCHSMPLLFDTEEIPHEERVTMLRNETDCPDNVKEGELVDEAGIPKFYLNMEMIQRSADSFLGVPFNITSSALMLAYMARRTGMVAKRFSHRCVNAHIYANHINQVEEQLSRDPLSETSSFPYTMVINSIGNIESIAINYKTSHSGIKGKMIV